MTDPLVRQVQDNRLLRMGGELSTTLGASMRATFDQPMLGGLIAQQFSLGAAATTGFTEEQIAVRREEQAARWRESDRLQSELTLTSDPARRDEIMTRIDELHVEGQMQLDALTRESIDAGRIRTPEELTEQYGGLGLTFDRSMTADEADLLAQNKREEIVRGAIIEAGPKGVAPSVARFGAGLAATAVDPVEFASMFIPVVGPAGKARLVSRFGRVGGRAAEGAIEGFVGSVMTEPFYYTLSRSQQLDYTMADALTNIGLGTVLGGSIGAGVGVFSRADVDAPRIDADLQRETADIALRQFATGQSVNITRFLDGTDLRGTTTLSRAGGIEFQAQRVIDLPATRIDTRPTILARAKDGGTRTFDTLQKAEVYAAKVGGEVLTLGDDFVVRQPIEGDFVRDPFGKPLTFETERAAEKFRGSARALPEKTQVAPINVNGRRLWAVTRDMSPADVRAFERGLDTAEIPDGINTREKAVLPDAEARIDEAVRGVLADVQVSKRLAHESTDVTFDPLSDVNASARSDTPAPETFAADTMDDMQSIVSDLEKAGELDADMKADLAEIKEIEIKSRSYRAASEAATACLLGG